MTTLGSLQPNSSVHQAWERLKTAQEGGAPDYSARMDALARLDAALLARKESLAAAISADFGHRSRHETMVAEVFVIHAGIKHARRHLRGWMKPERRTIGLEFQPAAGSVVRQPKGVIGILSPWNYPMQLALAPMIGAIAAGNRVLLKPSELAPATADWLASLCSDALPPDLVQVVTGGADVGEAVCRLALDHLVYTGSTRVGRIVMKAAAENLVPVTLELGGKSPAIVHPEFPVEVAAARILHGKLLNAGQTCIAPDYVLVPASRLDEFVVAARAAIARMYPRLGDNPDYTTIINDRHYARLLGLLEDAERKGARVIEINPASETLSGRKLAPRIVLGATEAMEILQEEIFGPLLPVLPYASLDQAIAYVNAHPRPLALYYFDWDQRRAADVLARTTSGGACVNATLLHCAVDDLPFGGIGPSGIGAYHGFDGFRAFSHEKAVYHAGRVYAGGLLAPPFGALIDRLLKFLMR